MTLLLREVKEIFPDLIPEGFNGLYTEPELKELKKVGNGLTEEAQKSPDSYLECVSKIYPGLIIESFQVTPKEVEGMCIMLVFNQKNEEMKDQTMGDLEEGEVPQVVAIVDIAQYFFVVTLCGELVDEDVYKDNKESFHQKWKEANYE